MRVGVVSKWFNRGQPVVGRQLRSAVDELGHESFVLARPKKERGPRPGALDRDDVWDQPGVTEAAAYEITGDEYERWVTENGIEAILCDQNYQFDELASLRRSGVRTIGRFVWEHFADEHVEGAQEAFDVIYSLTRAEQERYAGDGDREPVRAVGLPPGADRGRSRATSCELRATTVTYVFPGGFLGHRKPLEPVLEAFMAVDDDRACGCWSRPRSSASRCEPALEAAERDSRIEVRVGDQPTAEHLRGGRALRRLPRAGALGGPRAAAV